MSSNSSEIIYGPLPSGFLQITETVTVPRNQNSSSASGVTGPRNGGLLRVRVLQGKGGEAVHMYLCFILGSFPKARLAKNYSLLGSRMDPYVKISAGPLTKSSSVCTGGGTEPRWNEMVELPLLPGFSSLRVEVFDQRTIGDKMIAWGDVRLDGVDEETPQEDWYHLSGKQGKDKEGVINLHISFLRTHATTPGDYPTGYPPQAMFTQYGTSEHHGVTTYGPVPTYAPIIIAQGPYGAQYVVQQPPPPGVRVNGAPAVIQYAPPMGYPPPMALSQPPQAGPPPAAAPQQPQFNAEIIQLKEMFPTLDEDVLRSVLVTKGGSFDATVTELLSMS